MNAKKARWKRYSAETNGGAGLLWVLFTHLQWHPKPNTTNNEVKGIGIKFSDMWNGFRGLRWKYIIVWFYVWNHGM